MRTAFKVVGFICYMVTTYLIIHLLFVNYEQNKTTLEYFEKVIQADSKEAAITNELIKQNHELLMNRRALSEQIYNKLLDIEKKLK